ncbi:MAG: leucine-rich repeat domain-containing protein [Ruminococcaceae bacterium]|nr:leucine-rich repeat domain-containing protein [Oscillospiraceae bacterium]
MIPSMEENYRMVRRQNALDALEEQTMKRLLSILLLAAVAVACTAALPVETEAAAMGYYTYSIIGGKATITSVSSAISGNVTIPSTFGGYTVTGIGNYAFNCCTHVTSVTIPDSVTKIGDCAFYSCTSLTEMTIPDRVTSIGSCAFYYCAELTAISIPDSLVSIGNNAFADCAKLTDITLPNGVTDIGNFAFSGCNLLTIHCEEGLEAENYAKKSGIPIAYIGAVTHAHDYASDWTTDENSHWHPCSGCEEKGDYAAHAWNDGEVTKEATEAETGLKKYTCTVCDATKEETLDKLDVTANQGRNPPEGKFPWWIVIVPIVVIGGGAAAILFLKKKKKA